MNNTKVFLKNRAIMKRIVDNAKLDKDSVVLEIGSGDGRLTEFIAERAGKVYAVEMDPFLIDIAKEKLSGFNNIQFVNEDILRMEIPEEVNRIISNLPYAISSPVTEKLVYFMNKHPNSFSVLMYQKEFAERMIAFPGLHIYSMLSVFVQYTCEVKKIMDVSKVNFKPTPSVDSMVILLKPKNISIDESFLSLCRLLFQHKNKNLYSAILDSRSKLKQTSKDIIRERIKNISDDILNRKVFSLEIDELLNIYKLMKDNGLW